MDGEGWVFDADAARAAFAEGRHYNDGYVIRWKSNDNVPPADLLEDWWRVDAISMCELKESEKARDRETSAFLDAYAESMRNHVPSDEEMFEMRAAFGEGETVVNVITGRRIQL